MVIAIFARVFALMLLVVQMGQAASYIPLPVSKQLDESDGVIEGAVIGSSYKKLSTGEVVTVVEFKIEAMSGIKKGNIVNPNSFKILIPGGIWQGIHYKISGVPEFKEGEKHLLMIKESDFGFMLTNLGMGKYNIVRDGGIKSYVNSIFPGHPFMQNLTESKLSTLIQNRFGEKFSSYDRDKFVVVKNQSTQNNNEDLTGSRSPASVSGKSNRKVASYREESQSYEFIWLILLLGILGAIQVKRHKRMR